jgi:hypothetical protein
MNRPPLPSFELVKASRLGGGDRSVRHRFESGELTRLRAGVYLPTADWKKLDPDGRHRARVLAARHTLTFGTQFSHDSAAGLWGLPSIGPWPTVVHTVVPLSSGGRSSGTVRRHGLGLDPSPSEIDEVIVTSLGRTVIDMACTTGFTRAVAMVDNALRPPEPDEFRGLLNEPPLQQLALLDQLENLEPYRGSTRARRAIEFGSGLSGSVGESLSRVQFLRLGYPPPVLQVPFFDDEGFIGYADFYWPELDAIGEFDGDVKYLGIRYRRGRLPEEVVLEEKRREDRLRAVVRSFARWDWPTAMDLSRLSRKVRPLGLLPLR